jgi:hypothetical protein
VHTVERDRPDGQPVDHGGRHVAEHGIVRELGARGRQPHEVPGLGPVRDAIGLDIGAAPHADELAGPQPVAHLVRGVTGSEESPALVKRG